MVSAPLRLSEKSRLSAWSAFETAWEKAGLNRQCFIESVDIAAILSVLEKSFADELIDWLFKLCNQPDVLAGLATILERGMVRTSDGFDAIRAFAYVSFALVLKPEHKLLQPVELPLAPGSQEIQSLSIRPSGCSCQQHNGQVITAELATATVSAERIGDVKELDLSARTLTCLYRSKVFSIADLISCSDSDLLQFRNFGYSALDEVRNALSARGLALGLTAAPKQRSNGNGQLPQAVQPQLEAEWHQLQQLAINQHATSLLTEAQLVALCQANPGNQASLQLNKLLLNLKAVAGYLADNLLLSADTSTPSELEQWINALLKALYARLLGQPLQQAQSEINRLLRSLTVANVRNWRVYLQRCSGQTLAAIADEQELTRERVRQLEAMIVKAVGIKPADFVIAIQQDQISRDSDAELQIIQAWMARLNRLPIATDDLPATSEPDSFWQLVVGMNLRDRTDLLARHGIALTTEEYKYHYEYITERVGSVGKGYWRDFEHLKHYLSLHAAKLGAPHVMPCQTSLPDSVRGIVTSFGGQCKVAKSLGLEYHGQLVGADGRTYWTDEKLSQLLSDVNASLGLPADLMPSCGQVNKFIAASKDPVYQDKKPHSAVAALTKTGKLRWSETAARFDRRYIQW